MRHEHHIHKHISSDRYIFDKNLYISKIVPCYDKEFHMDIRKIFINTRVYKFPFNKMIHVCEMQMMSSNALMRQIFISMSYPKILEQVSYGLG